MEISGIHALVGKEAFPHLIPFPPSPPQFSPMAAYLSRLAPHTQRATSKLLRRIVARLGSTATAEAFPWSRLTSTRITMHSAYALDAGPLHLKEIGHSVVNVSTTLCKKGSYGKQIGVQ
jgi:hypothetical protein